MSAPSRAKNLLSKQHASSTPRSLPHDDDEEEDEHFKRVERLVHETAPKIARIAQTLQHTYHSLYKEYGGAVDDYLYYALKSHGGSDYASFLMTYLMQSHQV